jgi:hypothetical protein
VIAIPKRSFDTEKEAKAYLERLLASYFVLQPKVWVRHLEAGNRLRVDYLGRPRPNIALPFPFASFAVECKRSCESTGLYNSALEQAVHYTRCIIDDPRPALARINGHRIERVYVFPARGPDDWFCDAADERHATKDCRNGFCVNRLAGRLHIGMIHEIQGGPAFFASADRQWCTRYGARRAKHNSRQTVGNGALRRDAMDSHDHG